MSLRSPVTRFQGDIHLTSAEKQAPPPGADLGVGDNFWIIVAGGKYDFTAKWWNPASYQAVVDWGGSGKVAELQSGEVGEGDGNGRISLCNSATLPLCNSLTFVQCGEAGHWHPPLANVVNLVGKTSLREVKRKLADMGLSLGMDLDDAASQSAAATRPDDDDELDDEGHEQEQDAEPAGRGEA